MLELYVDSFIIRQIRRRSGSDLSKRPSNYSLIHFYKRCVSLLFSPGSPGLMLSEGLYDSPLIVRVISLSNIHKIKIFHIFDTLRGAFYQPKSMSRFLFSSIIKSCLGYLCWWFLYSNPTRYLD